MSTNPFKFTFDNSHKKIRFSTEEASDLRVINKIPGNYYLKCMYIVYFRSHDGYCSEIEDYETSGYELESQKLVTLYFSIPDDLRNEQNEINLNFFDDTQNLKSISPQYSDYFASWETESACCGVCGYTDLYVPQFVEYIIFE